MTNKYLISVVGTTAIGKTSLSILLAQHFSTEIISADSRQFFKEMCIGTAVPSTDELNAVKHHFIQHKSIHENYSVGHFEKDAITTLEKLFKTNDVVLMVGGSALYSNAVINGLDDLPEIDESIRKDLNKALNDKGLFYLQEKLKTLDPESFKTIAIDNPQRVIRALEICIGTGKPYSSFLTNIRAKRNFKVLQIGLEADREIIYNRINLRVDEMIEAGLLDEAKELLPYKQLNALNTVGYKELFNYFEGEWDLKFAISEIKKNTRRFAKRQLTWYRKDHTINWFNYQFNITKIIDFIENEIKKPAG
ncbi:MAG: tRNA (adenosine(37)-N6)-dimethylallyltransferase MiaA [Winogradskyella sp.]|nr:MAG: tRNA (adenosine(37)-N6)-dimethylallyltransferase MiaA [Winogradskyella sp.]